MPPDDPARDSLKDRFRGALLGTMVGDALGMPLEGMTASVIRARYDLVTEMLPARLGPGTYTDDTEMMIGLAEALLDTPGRIHPDRVAARFAENYHPERGYGANAGRILAAIREGMPWQAAVEAYGVPGGSYGNGAAMRVAPVALAFYPDGQAMVRAAAVQAEVTGHTHPIGRVGACLLAIAVRWALIWGSRGAPLDPLEFFSGLKLGGPREIADALDWIGRNLSAPPEAAAHNLGTGVIASSSVPAALWAVFSRPEDLEGAIVRAVNLGGDTDTIGAMAGAVAGAFHGARALPRRWEQSLEAGEKGRDYVSRLAESLFEMAVLARA